MPQDLAVVPGQPIVVNFPDLSELQRQALAAPRILELAASIPVKTEQQMQVADQALKGVLRARDALEASRTQVTGPLHRTKAWIDAQHKPVRDTLDEAARLLKDAIAAFLLAKKREQERQFQEAQAAMRQGDHAAMAQALNQSSAAAVSAPQGTSLREVWEAEVVNPSIVPYEFLCPDLVKIGQHAANSSIEHEPTPIPGVRFARRPVVTARR